MVDRKAALTWHSAITHSRAALVWLIAFIMLFFAQLVAGISVIGPDGLAMVPVTTVADILVAVLRSAVVASIATLIIWSLGKVAHVVGLMRG